MSSSTDAGGVEIDATWGDRAAEALTVGSQLAVIALVFVALPVGVALLTAPVLASTFDPMLLDLFGPALFAAIQPVATATYHVIMYAATGWALWEYAT